MENGADLNTLKSTILRTIEDFATDVSHMIDGGSGTVHPARWLFTGLVNSIVGQFRQHELAVADAENRAKREVK